MESFDLAGPLPTGTTLLEASAGTGKTFTVAALVARYVAEEGVPLDQLLVITFGRAASQELRERVREQLVAAERALADPATADRDPPRGRAPARRRRRRGRPAAPPAARRARLVRRGDDRDDPPVLPDGAALARGGRRHRHRRHPGRVARRARRRGGRRRLPPPLRPARRRPAVHPGHGADPGPHGRRRRPRRAGAVHPRPARTSRSPERGRGSPSPRRCATRSTGASGASGSCPTTTCSAGSPTP